MPVVPETGALRRGAIPVMAAACGVTIGNIYLCQPLLDEIARYFHVSSHAAGLVAVTAQIGYGLGILLVVPLADAVEPRRLMRVLLAVTVLGLLAAACAPSLAMLILASLVLATATVVPQALIPLAAGLVPPARRAKTIGTLQTGLVLGILLSRTIAGFVTDLTHSWRAAFVLAALATAALLAILPRFMPARDKQHSTLSYPALLASLLPLLRLKPVQLSMILGASIFAAFSVFWATLAFHLAGPGFGLGPAYAGLFGVLGAPGAILAPSIGRYADRIGPFWVNLCSGLAALLAFLIAGWVAGTSLLLLVLAVNLMDFGLQSGQVANQVRIFAIAGGQTARLNTVYIVGMFAGGAIGSWGGTLAWSLAGWPGVCGLAAAFAGVALVMLLALGRPQRG